MSNKMMKKFGELMLSTAPAESMALDKRPRPEYSSSKKRQRK